MNPAQNQQQNSEFVDAKGRQYNIGDYYWYNSRKLIKIVEVNPFAVKSLMLKIKHVESGVHEFTPPLKFQKKLGDDPEFDKKKFTKIRRRVNAYIEAYKALHNSLTASGVNFKP